MYNMFIDRVIYTHMHVLVVHVCECMSHMAVQPGHCKGCSDATANIKSWTCKERCSSSCRDGWTPRISEECPHPNNKRKLSCCEVYLFGFILLLWAFVFCFCMNSLIQIKYIHIYFHSLTSQRPLHLSESQACVASDGYQHKGAGGDALGGSPCAWALRRAEVRALSLHQPFLLLPSLYLKSVVYLFLHGSSSLD